MTALSADSQREKRGTGRVFSFPVKDATIIYKGGLVMLDADGFLIPAADTAALNVVGVAAEKVDNSSGADGDKWCKVDADCEFLFTASSITQAMLGTVMVVVDDNTVDDAAGATNDRPVGILTQFVSTTRGWVYVPGVTARLA